MKLSLTYWFLLFCNKLQVTLITDAITKNITKTPEVQSRQSLYRLVWHSWQEFNYISECLWDVMGPLQHLVT